MPISESIEMKLAEVLGDEKYQQFCNQRNEVLEATKTAGLHSAHWAMKNVEKTLEVVVKRLIAIEDDCDELRDRIDNAHVCI